MQYTLPLLTEFLSRVTLPRIQAVLIVSLMVDNHTTHIYTYTFSRWLLDRRIEIILQSFVQLVPRIQTKRRDKVSRGFMHLIRV